ncbi:MAG: hypothetical protein KBA72_17580, partial [Thermoanaerobaculia bacterium]|nr:hypothetical protein [Thermoanaerobaculia bacterium]
MFDRHAVRHSMPVAPVALALLAAVLVIVAEAGSSSSSWRPAAALLVAAVVAAFALPAIRRTLALRTAKQADRARLIASLDELTA